MPHDPAARRRPMEPDVSEDIEILEVVGVDEDGVPIEAPDPDDLEVVFDEGTAVEEPAPPRVVDTRANARLADARLREQLLRLQADFENFKKRIERERDDHFRYATVGLVARILPVLDNFERAMAAARPGELSEALVEGVALIHRQLLGELEAEGLRGMESVGEIFDPKLHEAVATDPESPVAPHTVTEVFQRGYFLHDRVLRPAMVRVRVDGSGFDTAGDDRKES